MYWISQTINLPPGTMLYIDHAGHVGQGVVYPRGQIFNRDLICPMCERLLALGNDVKAATVVNSSFSVFSHL